MMKILSALVALVLVSGTAMAADLDVHPRKQTQQYSALPPEQPLPQYPQYPVPQAQPMIPQQVVPQMPCNICPPQFAGGYGVGGPVGFVPPPLIGVPPFGLGLGLGVGRGFGFRHWR